MKRVVVVGTGAGGAMAARQLAGKADVTVLEAGSEFRPFLSGLDPVERMRSSGMLLDPRMIQLMFPAMRVQMTSERMALVRGIATGGTTTLATGNALRCDQALRELDIDLDREFAELTAELPISTEHRRRWRPVTRELFSACEGLGLEPQVTPKLVDYSRCTRCGRCVLGCPTGAKWDSRALLDQAVAKGARLSTGSKVERLVIDGSAKALGRVEGVLVRRGVRKVFVPADLVVLAAGGLGTPAILRDSGLVAEDKLFVDPVLCVAGPLDEARLDQEVPMPFFAEREGCIISPYFDYLSFFFERSWRRPRQNIVSMMIKLADSENGSVGGRRRVTKTLTERDKRRLADATRCCTEVLGRLGVSRDKVFLGALNAGHPGGTLPLTGRERYGLHADGLPRNLYVADASLLPRSLGKPPIMTIMALSKKVSERCEEHLS